MYIRTVRVTVPTKDRLLDDWGPEPQSYVNLLDDYRRQGKLLERNSKRLDDYGVELVWIWDKKESHLEWLKEPIVQERRAELRQQLVVGIDTHEEEI